MNTKNTQVSWSRGIYESAYDAFTNYMNILGDFMKRVESLYPIDMDNEELNSLLTTIRNQGAEIESLQRELASCSHRTFCSRTRRKETGEGNSQESCC